MTEPYLEVTYRHGRVPAAYLYLPYQGRRKSARTTRLEPGLVVDFAADGQPMGIEILAPGQLTLPRLNRVLRELGQRPVRRVDLAPFRAA